MIVRAKRPESNHRVRSLHVYSVNGGMTSARQVGKVLPRVSSGNSTVGATSL